MGLFTPVWKTTDRQKMNEALEAVAKMKNQSKLTQVAVQAPLYQVRKAAMKKLTDQKVLADIAIHDSELEKNAVEILTDNDAIQYVMENAESKDVRRQAALKLADRACRREARIDAVDLELLSEFEIKTFIDKAETEYTVKYLLHGIKDEEYLKNDFIPKAIAGTLYCYKETPKFYTSKLVQSAIIRVHDQEYLLKYCLESGPNAYFHQADRLIAVLNIGDDDKLFTLAKHAEYEVAKAAVSQMHNKEDLNWLITNKSGGNMHPSIGMCANWQLKGGHVFYQRPSTFQL